MRRATWTAVPAWQRLRPQRNERLKCTWELREEVEGKNFSNSCGAMFSLVENTGRTKKELSIMEGTPKYLNGVKRSFEQEKALQTEVEMTRNGGGE